MYQLNNSAVAPALAATGATAAYYTIGAWTLFIAGVALLYTARVIRRRMSKNV